MSNYRDEFERGYTAGVESCFVEIAGMLKHVQQFGDYTTEEAFVMLRSAIANNEVHPRWRERAERHLVERERRIALAIGPKID